MVINPDGRYENCYLYGYVYGFLQEDVDLAIRMAVTAFDDKVFSINIENESYVLPYEILEKLMNR